MNIFSVKELIQHVSQFSPKVYCSLRLLNHATKSMVDEVLPHLADKSKDCFFGSYNWPQERYLKRCMESCGFKLLDSKSFSTWVRIMVQLFRDNIKQIAILEKFCRDYIPKDEVAPICVIRFLCEKNRSEFIRELFLNQKLPCKCFDYIVLLEDVEVVKLIYYSMNKDIWTYTYLQICIYYAWNVGRWENITFLCRQHAKTDAELRELLMVNFLSFVERNIDEKGVYPEIRKDKEAILILSAMNWKWFRYADDALKKDKEFVLRVIKEISCARILELVDKSLQNDKEVVIEAVKCDTNALELLQLVLEKGETKK